MYRFVNIRKSLDGMLVLDDISMEAEPRRLICILGPSGCGKTTLLNIISGLTSPDSGHLEGFENATISYLFQENRLLPWKSVEANIAYVLPSSLPRKQRQALVNEYLELVGLTKFRHYLPRQLSGGMRQRVAIARAFAYPSNLLLMDEPFIGLDLPLKISLINECLQLWHRDERSVFYVTHDIREALTIGDSIYIFSERPSRIKACFTNDLSPEERHSSIKDAPFRHREAEIYDLLCH